MANRTYWEYCNPIGVNLKNVPGYGGTVSKAEIHFTYNGVDLKLVLHRPRLISNIHSSLDKVSGDLTEVEQVQCWCEPKPGGTLQCRIEITYKDRAREAIRCDEIEGLPG